jgi:hypothetical protein
MLVIMSRQTTNLHQRGASGDVTHVFSMAYAVADDPAS